MRKYKIHPDMANIEWSHWWEMIPGTANKCIILKTRKTLLSRRTHKILDDEGCVYWVNKKELLEKMSIDGE